MSIEERKQKERDFHNEREAARQANPEHYQQHYANKKFYAICGKSRSYIFDWIKENCAGKKVLDYCCGTGELAMEIAKFADEVHGVDISDESITTCKQRAEIQGVSGKTHFSVMDAENLEYEDNTFDVVVESGVLHHLELEKAFSEMARILAPTGQVLCQEALAHNYFIHRYRRRTPHLRTEWEVDHILRVEDINLAQKHFSSFDIKFFHLASIAAIPLVDKPGFGALLSALDAVDSILLQLPWIRKQAWQAVFTLAEPNK